MSTSLPMNLTPPTTMNFGLRPSAETPMSGLQREKWRGGVSHQEMKNHGFFTTETLAEKEDWVTTDLHVLQTAPSRTMERRERQERMSSVRLEL
ncbi:hypothetical protein AAC387_Pa07g0229 [Persea americana]